MTDAYLQLLVWKRPAEGTAVVYVCFQRLRDGMFSVQNAEFFHGGQPEAQWARLHASTGALFLDDDPASRGPWLETLDDAVAAHERDFADP